jgi:TolA-binding protein
MTGATVGTPGYMAPEQLRGIIDARSDQFALCVAIVEGLVGARPEAGMAPLLPGLPAALRDALIRGLAVDPSVRFATMADLADALLGALYSQVPRAARGWWWIAIPVAIAGAAITGGVAALVTHSNARGVPAAPVEVSAPKQEAAAKVVTPSTDGAIVQSASADPSHRVPDATIRSEAGNSAEGSVADPRLDTAAGAGTSHESRATSKPSGLRRISAEAPSAEEALKLLKQATDFERAGHWDEARTAWQRLEKVKDYRSEAMYHQAWAAFQVNDLAAAAKLTRQGASESGPYQTQAKFLLGDTLYRQGDYKHAKEYYLALHVEVRGDDRAIAMKKVAACNKMLRLPDDDGIRHN